jgi:hypothetical protein
MVDEQGEILTVPFGLRLECSGCREPIEPGEQCWVEHSDSSHVYHVRCVPAPGERQREPKQMLYAPHERAPLHRKGTLKEQGGVWSDYI